MSSDFYEDAFRFVPPDTPLPSPSPQTDSLVTSQDEYIHPEFASYLPVASQSCSDAYSLPLSQELPPQQWNDPPLGYLYQSLPSQPQEPEPRRHPESLSFSSACATPALFPLPSPTGLCPSLNTQSSDCLSQSSYAPTPKQRSNRQASKRPSQPYGNKARPVVPFTPVSIPRVWLRERECPLKCSVSLKAFQSLRFDTRVCLARFRFPSPSPSQYAKLDIKWKSNLFQCRLKIDVVAQLRERHAEAVDIFAVPERFWRDSVITDVLNPLTSYSTYWINACIPENMLLTAQLFQRTRVRSTAMKRPIVRADAAPAVPIAASNTNFSWLQITDLV